MEIKRIPKRLYWIQTKEIDSNNWFADFSKDIFTNLEMATKELDLRKKKNPYQLYRVIVYYKGVIVKSN